MPSETKAQVLATPPEKPNHYRYLKEFRVERCPLFPEHKCQQHRPFVCFNWHFPNQRRRRPIRKRDGTFNYSPDEYCKKYDETAGTCPDGDDCQFLHRTAGDTERRYHLRYFKTCMCVYETDSRGCCIKNGAHCAFAHGEQDKRPPVYDVRFMDNQEIAEEPSLQGPNLLDKERSLTVDDPKWQDANYVLVKYKTDKCQKLRLCQKGYACPQYHNARDRRRSPKEFKYRSTPCPNVKHGDDWGEPKECDAGDDCHYCHTRTEQQFHPEIYKSSKCHDVFSNQTCPRGPFCAFAHADHEMAINRNVPSDTNFADILSNALPNSASSSLPKSEPYLNNNIINEASADYYHSSITNNSAGLTGSSLSSSSGLTIGSFNRPSFAKAVSTYSNAASGFGTSGSHQGSTNLGGKLFDDRKSVDDPRHLLNGMQSLTSGAIGSHPGSSFGRSNQSGVGFDLESMIQNLDIGSGNYTLFATSGRDDLSRNDSPNTEKEKENDGDPFGGSSSDIPLTSGSKPVSIPSAPGFQYPRERFPSGSPMTSNHLGGYNPFGGKNDGLDQVGDLASNPAAPFFDFSPRQSTTMSPRGSIGGGINGVLAGNSLPATNPVVGNVGATGSSSNGTGLSILGNGTTGNGPGPIGSVNGSLQNNQTVINVLNRQDIAYMSEQKLKQLLYCYEKQAEAVAKALKTFKTKESTQYACLACKIKDRPRTIVLVPCDHQVLCEVCAPHVLCCPLCRQVITNRKNAKIVSD